MDLSRNDYTKWSTASLIDRIVSLEQQLKNTDPSAQLQSAAQITEDVNTASSQSVKQPRTFDWSKHNTRLIALKFAYIGRRYNGYEHHANNLTPLPTVEETLWQALMKAKLINPSGDTTSKTNAIDWEGCDYSKCGRTDRGVSAFGQVVGLRVRSNRMHACTYSDQTERTASTDPEDGPQVYPTDQKPQEFDDQLDELPYIQILNSLLPQDIRILAWCPNPPPGFSARFFCSARHYKYYFTQPAFMPTPGRQGIREPMIGGSAPSSKRREGWLDISRMQEAAQKFEGLHDFRNFCKLDPSKQISDFRRRIFHATVRPLTVKEQPAACVSDPYFQELADPSSEPRELQNDTASPQIYVFDLHGSAFLWHQVRHMVAVLFLVGQGLESPDVIDHLLDIAHCPEKPHYEMADDAPLVLWNCIFSENRQDSLADDYLDWIYVGETPVNSMDRPLITKANSKFGIGGAVDCTWALWRESKIDEVLRGSLLNLITRQRDMFARDPQFDYQSLRRRPFSQKVTLGAAAPTHQGKYIPLLKRARLKNVQQANREYAEKRGLETRATRLARKAEA